MSEKIGMAVQSMKAANAEFVQMENRLMAIRSEVEDLKRQKEELQKAIDAKMADANLRFTERQSQIRTQEEELEAKRQKLEADSAAFMAALTQAKRERAQLDKEKEDFTNEKNRTSADRAGIDQFVIALQRAYSVLPTSRP